MKARKSLRLVWNQADAAVELPAVNPVQVKDRQITLAQYTFAGETMPLVSGDGKGNDLAGSNGSEILMGLAGADRLSGKGGDDILIGGKGADILQGGMGNDTYYWSRGSGDDVLTDISTHPHMVEKLYLTDFLPENVTLSRRNGSADLLVQATWNGRSQILTVSDRYSDLVAGNGIEAIVFSDGQAWTLGDIRAKTMVWGNNRDDAGLLGTGYSDNLDGRGGDDILRGLGGSDMLTGGAGADLLDGGEGSDTASYRESSRPVRVNLGLQTAQTGFSAGDETGDVFRGIEHVEGSHFDDEFSGDSGANELHGLGGDDLLIGSAGRDRLFGGDGNDLLRGGMGGDFHDGGDGMDRASYVNATARVIVDLAQPSLNTGFAEGDRFVSVEQVYGSDHSDRLYGDNADNWLFGADGDDDLHGRVGDDILSGGDGADMFHFEAGWDRDQIVDFEIGADILVFSAFGLISVQGAFDHASQSGRDVVFDFGDGDVLSIRGVTIADLADLVLLM